jgi:hypothetical protein
MHVYFFSRDNDCADQALGNGLPFFKRELRQIRPQQWAKGRGIVDHLLPLDALLARVGQLSTFLLDLVQRGSTFLPPHLELTEGENLGLIGIKQALVLPLEPLPPLPQLCLLRLKSCEGLVFGGCPSLMQLWDHVRLLEQLFQGLPDHGIEARRADECGGTLRRPADRQWRMACALIVEVVVFFTSTQVPNADHAESALAAFDEGPE